MEYRIDSEFVIIGTGDTITNGSVVVKDGVISFVGEQEHAPDIEQTIQAPVVMPGMWETHAHFTGFKSPSVEQALILDSREAVLRATWDVREVLKSGFTSARELGGLGIYLNRVIQEGLVEGPRIYAAGKVLGTTGGHSDIHNTPLNVIDRLVEGNMPFLGELVDGVPECLKGVRKQLREGAEIIKFCASGGVMSKIDHPLHQQFSLEEQKAIVEEAKRSDIAVAAHCHGSKGISSALEAGVKTIEHGTYLTENLADQMIEQNSILVPTRYVIAKLLEGAEAMGVPDYAMEKVRLIADQHKEAITMAIKKGVKIALGTDIFVSGPGNIFKSGENAMELELLQEMGMSVEDCIKAATVNGCETLGPRAPKSGRLTIDYEADILLLNKNPLDDIKILQDRDNINQVIKSGKKVF